MSSALNTTAAEWFLLVITALHFFTHSWMQDRRGAAGKHVAEPMEILDELLPGFAAMRVPTKALGKRLPT